VDRGREAARIHIQDTDPGVKLAVLTKGAERLMPHDMEALRERFGWTKIPQCEMRYDQLVYPLIFWSGAGGCGLPVGASMRGATTVIRKVAIALILRPRGHFIHTMPTLREEFVCAISGRLISLNIQYLFSTQAALAREDEVRHAEDGPREVEHGLRTFIPPSLTDSDEYWHAVASKCFAISSQSGCPTFFLTFTMNPHWPDYQALKRSDGNFSDSVIMAIVFKLKLSALMNFWRARRLLGGIRAFVWRVEYQKRGLPHAHILLWTDFETEDIEAVDSVVNVRYPKQSPFAEQQSRVDDFTAAIRGYQEHQHSRGYRTAASDIRNRRRRGQRSGATGSFLPGRATVSTSFRIIRHSYYILGAIIAWK
jgi:hypothetical protein